MFRTLVEAGAPADILYQHKPHIGTDVLREVVRRLRDELLSLGCDVRFGHKLAGLDIRGGALAGLTVEGPGGAYPLPCDALVLFPRPLRPGHLPDAAGRRGPHGPQALRHRGTHRAQPGRRVGGPVRPGVGTPAGADYKLACHLPGGRSAFTFCVCPGGQVVAAASEEGRLVTNGMSLRARDGANSTAAFWWGWSPPTSAPRTPWPGWSSSAGGRRAAFALGAAASGQPAQTVGDFLAGRPSKSLGDVAPTYRPGVTPASLDLCLPDYVADTLRGAPAPL